MKTESYSSRSIDLDPVSVAEDYIDLIKEELEAFPLDIGVVGFIASDDLPSLTYAKATKQKFEQVGIRYDLKSVKRLDLESEIILANNDPKVHGIFIYFPIFNNEQDVYLRNMVDYRKDIEAGSLYWTRKLYANDRLAESGTEDKKAVIPCTPLAIVKMLTAAGVYATDVEKPIAGKVVSIFNRSEVIGRPLAVMMSNDGAKVYSFDINGPLLFEDATPSEIDIKRADALSQSDIVITGVPHQNFKKISANEVKPGTVCVNFSTLANFSDDIATHTDIYIPRIGPMTVAMCIRNTLRLCKNFHCPSITD